MVAQVRNADAGVRRLVASEVTEVLGRQSGLAKEAVANTAQIVAAVAAAVIGLPAAQQKRLKGKSADVATMIAARATVEASGGVTLETVRAIAETGVDVISVGALTHSAPSLDLGLDVLITAPED